MPWKSSLDAIWTDEIEKITDRIGKYVGPSQTEWSVDPYLCLSLSVINLLVKDWNNHRHNKDKSFSISIHLSNTMDVHFESVFFRIDNE